MSRTQIRIVERVLTRLKLKQLRLLVAVGEHHSILHAAQALNISQPAATKLIKDLELDFDVQLFQRTNRGMVPTVFGEALIRHGKLILAQISHAAQELDDLNLGNGGRVVLGTLLAASAEFLPRVLGRLQRERPGLVVKLVEGTNDVLMPALRAGDVDLVVGRLPIHRHRTEIAQERLFEEHVICVARAGHPVHALSAPGVADLLEYPWILPPSETTLRRQIDHMFVEAGGPEPRHAVESVSYLANRALLVSSDMLAVMPAHVPAHDIETGALRQVAWDVPIPIGPVGISMRKSAPLSPAVDAVLEALRAEAAAQ
ncbi:transcriptional regulator, LysR family [Cribrihabitans marinus]|uniref:Transcriptional regulator, LysR family n=1 Tax=Cribrihabitans marinus TaxID=1227549 RepID=A0A1H7B8S1_9RHOB|nr:LysR substrate-binding domain-containing protein [Cribrihabitans marinus]GGH32872.1 pca operon transcription factor PcaQ [Cribrihabitans marinus]SEJ70852.1 transcriptional regulator, LysR family [Cribrihabitans marinus]